MNHHLSTSPSYLRPCNKRKAHQLTPSPIDIKPFENQLQYNETSTIILDHVSDPLSPSEDPLILKDSPSKEANRFRRRQSRALEFKTRHHHHHRSLLGALEPYHLLERPLPSASISTTTAGSPVVEERLTSTQNSGSILKSLPARQDLYPESDQDHQLSSTHSPSPPTQTITNSEPFHKQYILSYSNNTLRPPERDYQKQTNSPKPSSTRNLRDIPPLPSPSPPYTPQGDPNPSGQESSPRPFAQMENTPEPHPDMISFSSPVPSSRSESRHSSRRRSSSSQYFEIVKENIVVDPSSSSSIASDDHDHPSEYVQQPNQIDPSSRSPSTAPYAPERVSSDLQPTIHVPTGPQLVAGGSRTQEIDGTTNQKKHKFPLDRTSTSSHHSSRLTKPIPSSVPRNRRSTSPSTSSRSNTAFSFLNIDTNRGGTPPKPRPWDQDNAFQEFEIENPSLDIEVTITCADEEPLLPPEEEESPRRKSRRKRPKLSMGHVEIVLDNWPLESHHDGSQPNERGLIENYHTFSPASRSFVSHRQFRDHPNEKDEVDGDEDLDDPVPRDEAPILPEELHRSDQKNTVVQDDGSLEDEAEELSDRVDGGGDPSPNALRRGEEVESTQHEVSDGSDGHRSEHEAELSHERLTHYPSRGAHRHDRDSDGQGLDESIDDDRGSLNEDEDEEQEQEDEDEDEDEEQEQEDEDEEQEDEDEEQEDEDEEQEDEEEEQEEAPHSKAHPDDSSSDSQLNRDDSGTDSDRHDDNVDFQCEPGLRHTTGSADCSAMYESDANTSDEHGFSSEADHRTQRDSEGSSPQSDPSSSSNQGTSSSDSVKKNGDIVQQSSLLPKSVEDVRIRAASTPPQSSSPSEIGNTDPVITTGPRIGGLGNSQVLNRRPVEHSSHHSHLMVPIRPDQPLLGSEGFEPPPSEPAPSSRSQTSSSGSPGHEVSPLEHLAKPQDYQNVRSSRLNDDRTGTAPASLTTSSQQSSTVVGPSRVPIYHQRPSLDDVVLDDSLAIEYSHPSNLDSTSIHGPQPSITTSTPRHRELKSPAPFPTPFTGPSGLNHDRVLQISSSDPKIAARAAAILKVYHGFIPRGFKVENDGTLKDSELQQEMESSIQEEESKLQQHSIRKSLDPIDQGERADDYHQELIDDHTRQVHSYVDQPGPSTIRDKVLSSTSPKKKTNLLPPSSPMTMIGENQYQRYQPNLEKWTKIDWQILESSLRKSQRQFRERFNECQSPLPTQEEVNPRIVVEKFLKVLGLSVEDCKKEWEWSALIRRVRALQKRSLMGKSSTTPGPRDPSLSITGDQNSNRRGGGEVQRSLYHELRTSQSVRSSRFGNNDTDKTTKGQKTELSRMGRR